MKTFLRRKSDPIIKEILAFLSHQKGLEFKVVFDSIRNTIRNPKHNGHDDEKLRLQVYERLQLLVKEGTVKKEIKGGLKTYCLSKKVTQAAA